MTTEQQTEAIRRAAELSVDHISAWFATGTGNSIFQSMRQEIERNMTESLKFTEDCQSAFKDQRIIAFLCFSGLALRHSSALDRAFSGFFALHRLLDIFIRSLTRSGCAAL